MLKVRVCLACLESHCAPHLDALAETTARGDLAGRVAFEAITCGESCARPARLWMQSEGGASYIFDGIDLASDADDILVTALCYLNSPNGWIEDARPCGRLRFCLTARVPA